MFFKLIPLEERVVLDAAALATVVYVDAHATGTNNGTSWANAYTDLQTALAHATGTPEQIWIAAGTYKPGALESSTYNLPDHVALYGGFAGGETKLKQRDPLVNQTILSGEINDPGLLTDNINSIVTVTNKTDVTLDGLFIVGAYNDTTLGRGGGIFARNDDGSSLNLTLSNMEFSNNFATTNGGAVYADFTSGGNGGTLNIVDSQFFDNSSLRGGAVKTESIQNLNLTNSDFHDNSVGRLGGAVFPLFSSSVKVQSSTFEHNTALLNGGALYLVFGGDVYIADSYFNDNHAAFGAGAVESGVNSNTLITRSVFTNNSTTEAFATGGAIQFDTIDSSIENYTVTFCTFLNNTSISVGGALWAEGGTGKLNISHNYFDGNSVTGGVGEGTLGLGGTGGAVGVDLNTGVANIQSNTFTDNSAYYAGGALSTGNGSQDITVKANQFYDNKAQIGGAIWDGGGLANNGVTGQPTDLNGTADLNIFANKFSGNEASSGSGNDIGLDGTQGEVNGQTSASAIINRLTKQNIISDDDPIEIL